MLKLSIQIFCDWFVCTSCLNYVSNYIYPFLQISRLSLTRTCKFDSCQKMFKLEYKLNIIVDLKNDENMSNFVTE